MKFPLVTPGLELRPFTTADAPAMHRIYSDEEVMRHVGDGPVSDLGATSTMLAEYIAHQEAHGFSFWGVVERVSGQLIGDAGLYVRDGGGAEVELGFTFGHVWWGHGYATEAGQACLTAAFLELGLGELAAVADVDNSPSIRVLEKLGFLYQGPRLAYGREHALYKLSDHDAQFDLSATQVPAVGLNQDELRQGTMLGGFVLETELARGGMGVVYRARDSTLDRPVALKVIAPAFAREVAFRERFRRESRLMATIEHPNVVPVYRAGQDRGRLYVAMRLIEGTDLKSILAGRGPLDSELAVRLISQIADALDAAHDHGLLHRDVKPANVLIAGGAGREHALLTDFGIAKQTGGEALTDTGQVLGTLDYIAPEILRGDTVDARADVYSLGCLLFEVLTGSVPYPRDSPAARIAAHLNQAPPSVRDRVGVAFDDVMRRALAKHPDERFSSPGELARAARAALERSSESTGHGSLPRAERLYQLGDGDFPPLKTLDPTNLPVATSPLVGREREVNEVVALLSSRTRLLTVTGPGGTGKTRLALQIAAELVGAFRDGVVWVPLAGLSDPELVASELAQAAGARDDLVGFLRGRELLILLDNFEHLLDAAPAVSALLSATDGPRVLVTSRSPLHVSGEREYRLEPLSSSDAAALFVERAGAFGRTLTPDATIEAICVRLDGLPLAVELAAARTKVLAPERLLERLDLTLPLLTGGARDAPERQRTLRATIEWSYDLLEAPNQELLERLSVFAGSFPLMAAEGVCGADLDRLAALVDSSLLTPIADDRFLMLETIREYARERVESSVETEALRQRHATFFSALTEQAYDHRFDAEAEWSERIAIDHDDLRAAFDWLAVADPERALGLAGALGWFWFTHGHLAEGRQRLADALARSTVTGAPRARALTAYGALTARCGDVDDGLAFLTEAIGLWRDLGDRGELASALDGLGWLLVYDAGDAPRALDVFEQSLELSREQADRLGETRALVGVCQVLVELGDVERAESLSRDLLEAAGGDPRTEHFAYHFLADCALIRGDVDEAEIRYRDSLRAALLLGDVIETSFEVQGVAMASAGGGNAHRALRLAASVEALWESLGLSIPVSSWDELLEKYVGAARETLGADADAVWAEGRAMPFDDAVAVALASRET